MWFLFLFFIDCFSNDVLLVVVVQYKYYIAAMIIHLVLLYHKGISVGGKIQICETPNRIIFCHDLWPSVFNNHTDWLTAVKLFYVCQTIIKTMAAASVHSTL